MSQELNLGEIQQRADAAIFNTQRFLDEETGAINYSKFDNKTLVALDAGPGRVRRQCEQSPIHLQPDLMFTDEDTGEEEVLLPSSELFLRDYNNFRTRFYVGDKGYYPEINDGTPVVQRFKILFPDVYAATVGYVNYREDVLMPNRPHMFGPLQVDGHYGPFMQFVYGLMAQLVDMDDRIRGKGPTVEEYGTRVHLTT